MLTPYLLVQIDVLDLENSLGDVVVDGLRADLNREQMHPFRASTDRIRGVLVFENAVFYITDEVLCRIELGMLYGVLSITLINDLTSFGKIPIIVRPV